MNAYKIIDEKQIDSKREYFSDLNAMDELLDEAANSGIEASVSPGELYAFALGGLAANADKVQRALQDNANIRAVFQDFLQKVSEFHVPQAIAASTADVDVREGAECKISIEPSQANPDQVYVIVELTGSRDGQPKAMHLMGAGNSYLHVALPEFHDGIAQLIEERTSEIVALLRNPDTEVFLK
jgi:hypothetical protein